MADSFVQTEKPRRMNFAIPPRWLYLGFNWPGPVRRQDKALINKTGSVVRI